jgi:DNA helicase II / ATP-dependent DNA helicase PcrA
MSLRRTMTTESLATTPAQPSRRAVSRGATLYVLNPAQQAAVDHGAADAATLAPPLLVVAGAGSGKTLILASRVARLLRDGADPQRLLLMTFSRRAAADMAHRIGLLLHANLGLGPTVAAPALPWCGTFHSVAARLLREHSGRVGLGSGFTVLDRSDAQDLMASVRVDLGLHRSAERFPLAPTCLAIHSRVVNAQAPLQASLREHWPWCEAHADALRALFNAFGAEKRRQHLLDYDDLLLAWWHLAAEPTLAREMSARFDHVLVDEYQDTNRLQADILRRLKPDGRGLVVVGDDAQAIYGFRAADVRCMLDFPARFDPPARVLTLEHNHRSTQPILAAANAVIALAAERFAKTMHSSRASAVRPLLVSVEDDAAQARWVAAEVLAQREQGLLLRRQAVLFRTSSHSAGLELELLRRGIPFVKFGGLRFLESAHVKDVVSLLRWADNPRARLAGLRAVRLVPGLGPASVKRLLDAVCDADEPAAAGAAWAPPAAARDEWAAFLRLQTALQSPPPWPQELALVLQWYAPQLQRLHDDWRVRQADLDHLARIAGGSATRTSFLADLALDPPAASSDQAGPPHLDEDYLILSTIHSAKGQEWSAVSVLNVVDGCIPSDLATGSSEQVEEERRLLYVAMTRARDRLALLVPQRFHVTQQRALGGRHLYATPSRFIPPEVQAHFDWVRPGSAVEPTPAQSGPVLFDLHDKLRQDWA